MYRKPCIILFLFVVLTQSLYGQSLLSIMKESHEKSIWQQSYDKFDLKKRILEPENTYKGPEVEFSICLPESWEDYFCVYNNKSMDEWISVHDEKDERYVYMECGFVMKYHRSDEAIIEEFIEYESMGLELEESNKGDLEYTVDSMGEGLTRVSVDVKTRRNDRNGKAHIYSISNGVYYILCVAGAPGWKLKSNLDMLLTIAESLRVYGSDGYLWKDPRFNSVKMPSLAEAAESSTAETGVSSGRKKSHTTVNLKQIKKWSSTGFILQSTGGAPSNAVDAAAAAIASSAGYFDSAPEIVGGLKSTGNKEAHLFFKAIKNGCRYQGLAISGPSTGGSGQTVTLFCDRTIIWKTTLPEMLESLGGGTATTTTTTRQKKQLRPEDYQWTWHQRGNNRVRMPRGWEITFYNESTISGKGPQGSFVFGFCVPVRYPGLFDGNMQQGNLVISNYHSPVSALVNVYPDILAGVLRMYNQPVPSMHLNVYKHCHAVAPAGAEAKYIYYRATYNGESSDELALVWTSPAGGVNAWQYYQSTVSAPAGKLGTNLPVLLEIWRSWEVNPQVFQRRINQAIRDMNIATETIQEVNESRNRSMHNSSLEWDECIRGYGYILDKDTDTYSEFDLHDIPEVVDGLNEAAGTDRFRKVHPSEIHPY